MQGAARVEGEHALGEAHACLCPPPEAVPVDGLRLGDTRVVHEREPDPEGILRQRRRNVLPCLALRLHLTLNDLPNTTVFPGVQYLTPGPRVLALQHLRPPSGPRPGPRRRGEALLGHQPLAGPPCRGAAD